MKVYSKINYSFIRIFLLISYLFSANGDDITTVVTNNGSYQKNGYMNQHTTGFTFTVTISGADQTTYSSGEYLPYVIFNGGAATVINGASSWTVLDANPSSVSFSVTDDNLEASTGWPGDGGTVDFQVRFRDSDAANQIYEDVALAGSASELNVDQTFSNWGIVEPDWSEYTKNSNFQTYNNESIDSVHVNWSGDDNSSQDEVITQAINVDGYTTVTGGAALTEGVTYSVTLQLFDNAHNRAADQNSNIGVDNTNPALTSITSDEDAGTYKIGDEIDFKITFNDYVIPSGGTLTATFNTTNTATATTASDDWDQSSSYAKEWSGTYTVQEGDEVSALEVTSLTMSAGTLYDKTYKTGGGILTANSLSMPENTIPINIDDGVALEIDGVRPTISSVVSNTAAGDYSLDEEIEIQINFAEDVTLSGTGAALKINLNTSADAYVEITSISSFSSATATYTVADGDEATALSVTSVEITNSGTLTDDAGNALTSFTIPDNSNIEDDKTLLVETTPPEIHSITGTDATYGIGDEVSVTVTFKENVTLSAGGELQLTFNTGGTASITSINSTTTATATYIVAEGETETSDLTVSSILLTGTITDDAGNVMDTSGDPLPNANNLDDNNDITIETDRPTISSITSSSNSGTYVIGEAVNITVGFNEAVTLSAGSMTLTLDNDATVSSSSISNALTTTFTYTVSEDDVSADLDVTSVAVSGGSLDDGAGNTMTDFSIPGGSNLADNKALKIDGVRPTIDSVATSTDNGYYNTDDLVDVTIYFHEPVSLIGGDLTIELETGGTDRNVTISSSTIDGSSRSYSGTYTVQSNDESSDLTVNTVSITAGTLSDTAGNGNAMDDFNIKHTNLNAFHTIVVDGVNPAAFTAGAVSTVADDDDYEVSGYWNGSNTAVEITVPIDAAGTDASLIGGTVQIQGRVDANNYENLGSLETITTTDRTDQSKTITVSSQNSSGDDIYEMDTDILNDGVLSFKAFITDIAGNQTEGTVSNTTLTIDTTAATVSSATSSTTDGVYMVDDVIDVSITFDSDVSLTSGAQIDVTMETGTTDNTATAITSLSSTSTVSTNYTVQSGDANENLDIKTLSVSSGDIIDVAGNPMTSDGLSIQSGTNISQDKQIEIDGISPDAFITGNVVTAVGSVVSGYWNETNDSVYVTIPLTDSDVGLDGGSVILEAKIDANSYEEVGSVAIISTAMRSAGTVTVGISGSELEDIGTSYPEGGEIFFRGKVSDEAGNSTTGNTSSTTLIIDQTYPTIDNVDAVTPTGGTVINTTYWNMTNDGIIVEVPIDNSDNSLSGGKIRLQSRAGLSGSWESVADFYTITDGDLSAGTKAITADTTNTDSVEINEVSGFANDLRLYYRTLVSDVAGNTSTFIESSETLLIDIQKPTVTLTYSTPTTVSADSVYTITATFDDQMETAPQIAIDYNYENAGAGDDVAFTNLSIGADNSIWTHSGVTPSGIQNNGYAQINITGTDIAGNTVNDPSLTNTPTLFVDNTLPTVTLSYVNSTKTYLNNEGRYQDVIQITAKLSEPAQTSPAPLLNIEYADSTNDSFLDLASSSSADDDSTWVFDVALPDSVKNTGIMTVSLTAKDIAGNFATSFTGNQDFSVDNTPPVDFATGTVTPQGLNQVIGWYNSTMDSVEILAPVPSPAADASIQLGGKMDIQMFNIVRGSDWVTIPTPDSIAGSGTSVPFFRTTAEIESIIPPGTGLIQGDTLLIRAVITDRVGNTTYGDSSLSRLVYDPFAPTLGAVTAGVFFTQDTIISSDSISASWSEFTDSVYQSIQGSGLSSYEYKIQHYDAGGIFVDNLQDWTSLGLNDNVAHNDLELTHDNQYSLHIRAIDFAGNISEIVDSDTIRRINSAPIITAILDTTQSYEDVLFTQTILFTDVDTATILGDQFTYNLLTTHQFGHVPADTAIFIPGQNVINWTPTQSDTGLYTFRVIIDDNWTFSDTVSYLLFVNAVNDTPTVAVLTPHDNQTMLEDQTAKVKFLLSQYGNDVDNDSTQLTYQVAVLDTSSIPGFPTAKLFFGNGTPEIVKQRLNDMFNQKTTREDLHIGKDKNKSSNDIIIEKRKILNTQSSKTLANYIQVDLTDTTGIWWAEFNVDSNYFGSNHRILFFVSDPDGATSMDTVYLTITPENDPPQIATIPLIEITENQFMKIDFADYVTDIDDTLLTIRVAALTNNNKMAITTVVNGATTIGDSLQFLTSNVGDTVLFTPEIEWSDTSLIQISVIDAQNARASKTFVIDILRVPRPNISLEVIQNNAFTNFFEVILTDTVSKTDSLFITVQGQPITLDTVASYTYVGHYSFENPGTYSFYVKAWGVVGDTTITRSVNMALAKAFFDWTGYSPDGNFRVYGSSGSVPFDQSLLIVDSTMFNQYFHDRASYRLGRETSEFDLPVEISISSISEDLAIYQRRNGVEWIEIPSISEYGQIIAYTDGMGYFRLGPKTLIVPGESNLHQNYPNPFNPVTNIIYDVGFSDGPQQRINVVVYNLLGQHVRTLVNEQKDIGRYTVRWDGHDKNGIGVSSGIYFVRMMNNYGRIQTKKMMLLR